MGEGEGRDEAREQKAEDDKDDSENDHGVYLVSVSMCRRRIALGQCLKASFIFAPACLVLPLA
jgi:hypothetical protein